MPTIEVDQDTKTSIAFAARMADVSEAEIVRRMVAANASAGRPVPAESDPGVAIFAEYEGRRTRAIYYPPGRIEIIDGPLRGRSFRTPSGAARAVVRHYNPAVNDNRNGWTFWQIDTGGVQSVWLQTIRPMGALDRGSNDVVPGPGVLRSFKNNGLRIIFVLLCAPKLAAAPLREIAEVSGTTLSAVHNVLTEMQQIGYVSSSNNVRRLRRSPDLFERWVSAYALDLYPRLKLAVFNAPDPDWWRHSDEIVRLAGGQWGAEVAAKLLGSRLLPGRATIYTSDIPSELAIKLRFQRATENGNVEIRRHFWSGRLQPDSPTVPSPLVYADLMASGDPREIEAAEYLKESDEVLRRLSES